MEKLLGVKQVAEIMGLSLKWATKHMERSGLAVDLGLGKKRRLHIKESDIVAYIETLKADPSEPMPPSPREKAKAGKEKKSNSSMLMTRKQLRAAGLYPPKN